MYCCYSVKPRALEDQKGTLIPHSTRKPPDYTSVNSKNVQGQMRIISDEGTQKDPHVMLLSPSVVLDVAPSAVTIIPSNRFHFGLKWERKRVFMFTH